MIHLFALLLGSQPVPLAGLDTIPAAEISRIDDRDAPIRTEISRISNCLRAQQTASECLAQDDCTQPQPSACANISAEAWKAYMRHYLTLLTADPIVAPVARASQRLWETSAQADCEIDGAIGEVRRLPYHSLYAEVCIASAAQARALALRDYVINLYGDASIQGGVPYPRHLPFIAEKR